MRDNQIMVCVFLLGLMLMGNLCVQGQVPDRSRYEFPQNLALELAQMAAIPGGYSLQGTLQGRVGKLRDLTVFFDVADGWRVETDVSGFGLLDEGHQEQVSIRLLAAPPASRSEPPWIMMRVSYLPDYVALVKVVKGALRYPDPVERSRLLGIVRRNFQANSRQTDGVRLDIEPSQPSNPDSQGETP